MWLKTEDGSYINMDNVEFVWADMNQDLKSFSIKAESHTGIYHVCKNVKNEKAAQIILAKLMKHIAEGSHWDGEYKSVN